MTMHYNAKTAEKLANKKGYKFEPVGEGYFRRVYEKADPDEGYYDATDPSRRKFVRNLLLGGLGLAVGGQFLKSEDEPVAVTKGSLNVMPDINQGQDIAELPEVKEVMTHTRLHEYPAGNLFGRRINHNSLYGKYLNLDSSIVPDRLVIDFYKQLEERWSIKEARYEVDKSAKKTADEILIEYRSNPITEMDLSDYCNNSSNIANQVRVNLNWQALGNHFSLEPEKLSVLQMIASDINGEELMAYVMTELMPAPDGDLNKNILDFLLRNAGREFLEAIPAQGDKYNSFGPFQFTYLALAHTPTILNGVSAVNLYVDKDQKIPGSVMLLRGDDHIRAAVMFVIYNLLVGIRKLSDKQLDTLKSVYKDYMSEIVQFVATAHHKPSHAYETLKRWLDKKGEVEYKDVCSESTKLYALKTESNYQAMTQLT